jgi:hypothetical protein
MTTSKPRKPKVKLPWWKQLLKIVIGILVTITSSQLLSSDPQIDKVIKAGVVITSNVIIDAMTNYSTDTVVLDTVVTANTTNSGANN